ncbi:MAG TPA: site-2 protease family protein, partial [Acidimicrobiales bacterium]|nr:site-2 protease family protein [Acidimicrobiales bacterium]
LVAIGAVLVDLLVRNHRIHSYQIVVFCLLIPSIILHEVSHGAVAYLLGDDTAKKAGRLTLNPISHIDPFGSIILPAIMAISSVGAFGWAKPVPVTISNLRRPRDHAVLVGLAGPATNIVIAVIMALVFRSVASPELINAMVLSGGSGLPPTLGMQIIYLAGFVNVILAAFNLIPIPPLDGSAVIERLLPTKWMPGYYRLRTAMIVVVLLLVLTGSSFLNTIFNHALDLWIHLIG